MNEERESAGKDIHTRTPTMADLQVEEETPDLVPSGRRPLAITILVAIVLVLLAVAWVTRNPHGT